MKKKSTSKKKPSRPKAHRPLPASFAGADVVDGKGMHSDDYDQLLEEHALDEFITSPEGVYLVIDDDALTAGGAFHDPALFVDRDKAIQCARSRACGNTNHRVLKVTDQVLVVGTDNELPG